MGTEELRAFYDNELMPALTGLELKRKEIVKKSMIAGAIFLLTALMF